MRKAWLLMLGWGLCCGLLAARAGVPEIEFPEAQRQKLEKFKAFQIQKADQSYANGKYDLAAKEYAGFMVEFAKSPAVAYAAVRKGRCAQLANNLHEAIKEYTEVADYFFDQPLYAAAALYFHGACYWERRDPKKRHQDLDGAGGGPGLSAVPVGGHGVQTLGRQPDPARPLRGGDAAL